MNAAPTRADVRIDSGTCHALYAYDIGASIDLDRLRRLLSAGLQDSRLRHNRRAPKYFDYRPAPLLITQDVQPPALQGFATSRGVEVQVYDFGAVSLTYRIPVSGTLGTLRELSCLLSEDNPLLSDSRQRADELLQAVRKAVDKPRVAGLVEDYTVFHIESVHPPLDTATLHESLGPELAQVLRAERALLSTQEVSDALTCRLSYERDDVTFIDWNAAIIIDRDADDVRAVLEFANVELLEMRYLDRQLDDALTRAYDTMSRRRWWRALLPGRSGANIRRVSQMQVDGALVFERVTNAPKLLGDQYLARVYRLASLRFHLPEWNTSALRTLESIQSIYQQMHDTASGHRMEILEWIIILLFVLEIVLSFVR
jgi:hypothetical protein